MTSLANKRVECTIIGMNESSYYYKACSNCETALSEDPLSAPFVCNSSKCAGRRCNNYKRLFRLVFTIELDNRKIDVVCFDRAAKYLFGCTAEQFFKFDHLNPFAVKSAGSALTGERFKVTLKQAMKDPENKHYRMTEIEPVRPEFQPVIQVLEELYDEIYGKKLSCLNIFD